MSTLPTDKDHAPDPATSADRADSTATPADARESKAGDGAAEVLPIDGDSVPLQGVAQSVAKSG